MPIAGINENGSSTGVKKCQNTKHIGSYLRNVILPKQFRGAYVRTQFRKPGVGIAVYHRGGAGSGAAAEPREDALGVLMEVSHLRLSQNVYSFCPPPTNLDWLSQLWWAYDIGIPSPALAQMGSLYHLEKLPLHRNALVPPARRLYQTHK